MRNFPQYLLVFLLGAGVGAGVVLVTQPGFSVVVTTLAPSAVAPAPTAVAAAPKVETPKPAASVAPVAPVAKAPEPVAPKPVAPVAKTEVAPAPAPSAPSAPGLDFAALAERPTFWPAAVSLTTATSVSLLENGKRTGDLPLAAGAVLQLSKVLATGAIEVRAQGQKFEVDSKLTDFESIVRKKVQELVEKDDKTLAPILRTALAAAPVATPTASATPTAPVAMPTPAPAVEAPKAAAAPTRPTFEDKVNTLFGRKAAAPEKTEPAPTPSASAVPAAPVAPAAAATPAAPAADAKAQDKKADLDRRMNGLFGSSAK